jgi:hypothetical protein
VLLLNLEPHSKTTAATSNSDKQPSQLPAAQAAQAATATAAAAAVAVTQMPPCLLRPPLLLLLGLPAGLKQPGKLLSPVAAAVGRWRLMPDAL